MALSRSRRGERGIDYWPGFVDALSTFLLAIIFMLSVFMLAQYFLSREIVGKDDAMARLNRQIAELSDLLQLERGQRQGLQDNLAAISATLGTTEQERRRLQSQAEEAQSQAGSATNRALALEGEATAQRRAAEAALAQVELLNQQIAALRRQFAALENALAASEARDRDSQTRISDLGRRLNLALAQRVQELSRYRSEFFGRLREILAERPDVRVVGDRFVFGSEVFFASSQAVLEPGGRAELDKLADALTQVARDIPQDIPWVLRIDGHTDARPISGGRFASNWDLSAARAIAVVQYLIGKGIPPQRLMAAGFGEFQPIEPGDSPEALARNRRIEVRLTDR
ncbi:peptidoglycan -binding protein [Phreatobacter sp. AB_2022a]|uniref:peptidoglycan -binding protein n=1 Tax=Phreatobacter sp. AB_2022a TaxID=3003134 RepID=UPI002286F6C0|nr:peptidoglycan -binding protein [Phreatobacter sp. AB_2022a]MCZ0738131.1 peptidoglycan -binding protein [Phreatobacter sp. AB_2022a]